MKWKKAVLFALLILFLGIGGIGYYLYQKPRTAAGSAATDATLTAGELYKAFQQNEQAANKLYLDKVLEITGTVAEVQADGSLLLSAGEGTGGINCSLAKTDGATIPTPGKGAIVKIKGKCTGFLMDVNLADAVIE